MLRALRARPASDFASRAWLFCVCVHMRLFKVISSVPYMLGPLRVTMRRGPGVEAVRGVRREKEGGGRGLRLHQQVPVAEAET